jgi:Cof subfamily protein (haloacid dehalogenase superfamily)
LSRASAFIPRLIATDLDGTLLRPDKTVSPRVRAALDHARRQNVLTVIATARPPQTARLFAEMAGVDGIVICANGAIVYDLAASAMLSHRTLEFDAARALVASLRERLPGVCFGAVQGEGFAAEPAYAAISTHEDHESQLDRVRVCEADLFWDRPLTKLVIRHADHHPTVLLTHVRDLGLTGFEANFSGAPFMEIVGGGVSKGQALADFCAEREIAAADVIAFGDAPNDIPMLRWAGHGVSIGDRYPEVGAAADEIAPSSQNDGVAVVLERLFGVPS